MSTKNSNNNLDTKSVLNALKYNQGNIGSLNDYETKRLIASIYKTESSGGDLDVVNSLGFTGKYQAGTAYLVDAGFIDREKYENAIKSQRRGKVGSDSTWEKGEMQKFLSDDSNWKDGINWEKFKSDSELQDRAFYINANRDYKRAIKEGVLTENDPPEKVAGFLKACLLGGYIGAKNLIENDKITSDANGTSTEKYYNDIFNNKDNLDELMKKAYDSLQEQCVDNWCKKDWLPDDFKEWLELNRSGKFHIYDPLVLDLDGDGIELLKANGWNGVQFDYNGDGIKSSTGWVKSDDGLLVWDRNGDGIINNGSEIFGEDMFPQNKLITSNISNTSSGNASNSSSAGSISVSGAPSNAQTIIENDGFYALSQLDSNQDGIIDTNDENFRQIKVWRDLNQDGISQEGELFGLNELNIQSINLNTGNTKNNTAGNSIGKSSTYTKTDGSNAKIADINFTLDTVHSEYIEHITIGEEQMLLPYLHGVGKLRDLREAATLSPELTELLKEYQLALNKEQQTELLDKLMLYWARTNSSFKENCILFDVGNMVATAEGGSTGVTPSQAAGGGVMIEDFV